MGNNGSRSIHDLSRASLADAIVAAGEARYRTDQVWRWLYRGWVEAPEEMSNVPAAVRARIDDLVDGPALRLERRVDSGDGLATKLLFRLSDGQLIETVLMHFVDPADEVLAEPVREEHDTVAPAGRHTVCVSTQVGCAMGCVFCATGQMGLVRNLSRGECVAQVAWCARELRARGERISNVVFMGMGEPLANWPATWGAVQTLVDPSGAAMSPRRLTVSTVGIVPGIRRIAAAGIPVRLAVSLHAADDALRSSLVPVNATYPLSEVLDACREYQAGGGRRLTFEYVLIAGVNDRPADARGVSRRLLGLRAHVNLIRLNPTASAGLRPSPGAAAREFERVLEHAGIGVTQRSRRGIEIRAGCGQLRGDPSAGTPGRSVALRRDGPSEVKEGRDER